MKEIHKEILKKLKVEYPQGTRLALIKMDDPYSTLHPGDKGTVAFIDDLGTIHVHWDKGSSLGLVFGEDKYKKVEG